MFVRVAVGRASVGLIEEALSRLERLDAKVKVSPGQMGLDFTAQPAKGAAAKGAGTGQQCGAGWIPRSKTCRKGQESQPAQQPNGKPPTPQVSAGLSTGKLNLSGVIGGDREWDASEAEKKAKGGLKFFRMTRGGNNSFAYFFRDRDSAEHWYAKDVAGRDADDIVGSNKRRSTEWREEYKAAYRDTRNLLSSAGEREILETIQAYAEAGKATSRGTSVDVRILGNKHSRPIREGTFGATSEPAQPAEQVLTNPGREDPGLAPKPKQQGLNAQDVTNSGQQAAFARQQRQAAAAAGDQKGAAAWQQEARTVERQRLQGAINRTQQSQSSLFGVTEYDETMPLFRRQDSVDPVAQLVGQILAEQLPGAQVLDWSRQPRGITAGRAVSEGLVYRFRCDSDSIGYRPAWEGIDERQWELRSEGFLLARDPDARMDFKGPKFRQQQTKRKCSKGYGCGSACIAMGKECRVNPSSAISKVRLKQLQALAQEGDAKAAAQAQELQLQRDAKAQGLQQGRQTAKLQELLKDPRIAEMVRTGRVPTAEAGNGPAAAPKPGDVRNINPGDVEVDPERFQYKLAASKTGEVGSLSGVQKWDPNLAGVVSVWQDPADGKTYVINGHNRLALAKRLGAEEVTVRYLKAGSAKEARAIGAMQNIAEGAGSEVDAGKFFRDTGITSLEQAQARGLPLRSGKTEKGLALAQLPDEMFQDVVQGDLRMRRAAVIGASGLDQDKQREVYKVLKARPSMTDETLQEYVEHLAVSSRQTQTEIDLFGSSKKSVDTGLARAELSNGLKKALSREARLLGAVSKNSQAVELLERKGGNTINVEQSQQQAQEANSVLRVFNQLKSSGQVGAALDQAAARLTAGENKSKVQKELREAVIQAMEDELKQLGLRKEEPPKNEAPTMSMFDGADRFDALELRLDALKRKCTTGYGCGSTCINVKKECRSQGGAATSKERIKRLQQLAAGEIKPKGFGGLKPAEAAAMATQLQGSRNQQAQALMKQRQETRAAKEAEAAKAAEQARKEAAAKEATTGRGKPRKGTPRAEAETVQGSGDYEFARDSAIGNAGEDLANSARHKRNAFRTIVEAEASGEVEKLLTRDNLMKNFPTDLISEISPYNVLSRMEAHLSLKTFPNLSAKEVDSYVNAAERRRQNGDAKYAGKPIEEVDAKTVRKQYFDAFQTVRQFVEDNQDLESGLLRRQLASKLTGLIASYRGEEGSGYSRTYRDPYNPTANALVDMQRKLVRTGSTSVYGQMNAFAKALNQAGKLNTDDARGAMERAVEPARRIIEGESLAKAFGQENTSGKWRFNPGVRYVGDAKREGGRQVGGTPQAATDEIIKGLGFRGLQYGNSVTDDERAHHVQKAAEALVDLADAIGLPDKAIGLNGTLGLAIGARGRGGAAAHYEPDLKVINLTRKNGVGSLSHEWGHALDNYVSGGTDFLSDFRGRNASRESIEAMSALQSAWSSSGFLQQVHTTLREIKKAGGMMTDRYWLNHKEMLARSFEAHVSLKLAKNGRSNTYLTRELHEGGMRKGEDRIRHGDGLWPSRQQAEAMEPMFDALIAQLRKDHFPGPTNRNDSRDERIWRFMHAMVA